MSEQPQEQGAEQQQPMFGIEKIYLKDLSVEVPNAPQIFFDGQAPQVEVNIHNQAAGLEQQGLFEVVLTVTVTAKIEEKTVFLVEAAQAGIFQIVGVPQSDLEAVLGTICPNTLLPYARETVSTVVQRAGFPPVTLQHMNFDVIYQQRMQQLEAERAAQAAGAQPTAH